MTLRSLLALVLLLPLAACSAGGAATSDALPMPAALSPEEVDTEPEPVGGDAALQPTVEYPVEARRSGIQGEVQIRAVVDTDGRVVWAAVETAVHPLLDQASLDAVRSFRFEPATLDGRPVQAWTLVPVGFHLRRAR